MFYITGDTHGNFTRFFEFCNAVHPNTDDVVIILGDAGFNYYGGSRDKKGKFKVSKKFPVTFFCVHGNHEIRPEDTGLYKEKMFYGGRVWYEETFPTILFAIDGEIYTFPTTEGDKKCLVIGGAYSVDKFHRLRNGFAWFENEQPSDEIKRCVEDKITSVNNSVDIVFSHTCPLKYEPTEVFLPMVDQSTVDKTTETWLGKIESILNYNKWYCGHYHTEKTIDKIEFLYKSIKEL